MQHHHQNHHVSFDSVHVYEFMLVVGDNPSCRQGLPIELSWECIRNTIVNVDIHEQFRQDKRKRKQKQKRRRRCDDDHSYSARSKNNVCLQRLRPLSILKRTRLLQEHGAIPKTAPRRVSSEPITRTNRWQNAVEIDSYKSYVKAKQERYDDDNFSWSVVVDGARCDGTTTTSSSSRIRDITNMNDDCNHRAQLVLQRMMTNNNNINKNIEIEKQPSTTHEESGGVSLLEEEENNNLWQQTIQGMVTPPIETVDTDDVVATCSASATSSSNSSSSSSSLKNMWTPAA